MLFSSLLFVIFVFNSPFIPSGSEVFDVVMIFTIMLMSSIDMGLSMLIHACNLSSGEDWIVGQPGLHSNTLLKTTKWRDQNSSDDKGAGHKTWWLQFYFWDPRGGRRRWFLFSDIYIYTVAYVCVHGARIQGLAGTRRALYQESTSPDHSLLCVANTMHFSPGTTSTACHKLSCLKFFVFIFHQF